MMTVLMVGILKSWSEYYGDHQAVSVAVRFMHLVGLLLGGGTALFIDRQVLRAARGNEEEKHEALRYLRSAHVVVVPWLMILGITGILMTAADTETFLVSRVYWIKMAVVALLAVNGGILLLAEKRVMRLGTTKTWSQLATVSTISFLLWIGALLMGTLLTVAA
jgi:uncharacterized membrane-anchored protein